MPGGAGRRGGAGPRWAQVIDVEIIRKVTEWALPGLSCPCCGTVTFAGPPAGAYAGAVSYGPALNAAAVLLTPTGTCRRSGRAGHRHALGTRSRAGWVDKAAARLIAQLGKAGFDDAMSPRWPARRRAGRRRDPGERAGQDRAQPAGPDEKEEDPEEKDGKAAAGAPQC